MKISDLAQCFEQIEQEFSRTEINTLLAKLLQQCNADEAQIIAYLVLGLLFPPYKTMQLNIAKKGMVKIIADVVSQSESEVKYKFQQLGDLGLTVQDLHQDSDTGLTVMQVYESLVVIAQTTGTGSTEHKAVLLRKLLQQCDPVSAKYIVRIVTKTLRLGFSDMTLIDALSWMQTGDKSLRTDLEYAYNVCADLGLVAYTIKSGGIDAIKKMSMQVGIPVRPAAAERLNDFQAVIDKLGPCIAQPKLDGFRLQLHVQKKDDQTLVYFFSRNLLDMSEMFPDLTKVVQQLPVQSLICEGEAIVYDQDSETFLPFQETVKRKRKHGVEEVSQQLPLRLYLFDVLYFDGQSFLDKTHVKRRQTLEQLVQKTESDRLYVIDEYKIDSAEQLQNYFLQNIQAGLEGLVVKRPDAMYQPGKRNFNWIKIKRHARGVLTDTIDAVILGYYHGQGKRAQFGIGAFLVGVYKKNRDIVQSVAKVGTGLKDHEWKDLKKRCDAIKSDKQPHNVDVATELHPDVWVYPELVCVIQSEEITMSPVHTAGKTDDDLGFALRFPRFIEYRVDKSMRDSTSVDELRQLFKEQKL